MTTHQPLKMALGKDLGIRGIRRIQNDPVKPGAVFKQGDFLYKTSTGLDGPPAPGNDYDVTTNKIAGRACCDSVGTDGVIYTSVPYEVAERGTQFCISLRHNTPASAVPTAAIFLPGTVYALRNETGGYPALNLSNTGVSHVHPVEPDPQDTPGYPATYTPSTPGANVWVEFISAATANPGAI